MIICSAPKLTESLALQKGDDCGLKPDSNRRLHPCLKRGLTGLICIGLCAMKANSSYAISKRVVQSTGVSHCLKANFTSRSDINLVLARGPLLQIYTLHEPMEDGIFPAGILSMVDEAKLFLSFETTLFSNIEAMGVVRLPGRTTDALILSFADAKVSVVEWEADKRDLAIVSLHYFEKDAGAAGGVTQFVAERQVIVDYHNRCACVLIYDEMLAVIPFVAPRGSGAGSGAGASSDPSLSSGGASMTGSSVGAEGALGMGTHLGGEGAGSSQTSSSRQFKQPAASYIVKLPELGISNIRDIKFLHGYYEPTIMVIYEPTGTWAGRLAKTRNTVSVAIIELDISLRRKMLIWSMDKLPHDSYRICPLKEPGGVIVFSSNALIFIDHSSKYRLTLNSFGDSAEHDPDVTGKFVFEKSKVPISLDDAKFTFLNDRVALLSLETGALFFMTIITDGRSVTHIDLTSAGSSIVTTGMCTLNERYFFVAAKLANSILLSYTPQVEPHASKRPKFEGISGSEHIGIKSFGQFSDWCDEEDLDRNVVSLLSTIKSDKSMEAGDVEPLSKWDLRTVDTLISVAPMADFFLRPKEDPNDAPTHETTDHSYIPLEDAKRIKHRMEDPTGEFDIVGCCGYERSGALCILSKTMPHTVLDSAEFPDSLGVWSLYPASTTSASVSSQMPGVESTTELSAPAASASAILVKSESSSLANNLGEEETLPERKEGRKRTAAEALDSKPESTSMDTDHTTSQNEVDGAEVADANQQEEEAYYYEEEAEEHHKVVLITSTQQTQVLLEGESGITVAPSGHGFLEDETLGAGNVLANRRMVQVCYYDIVLVDSADLTQTQKLAFGTDAEGTDRYAVWCSILDPYVLVLLNEQELVLFEAKESSMQLERVDMRAFSSHDAQSAKIATVHLFKDSNNMIGFNQLNEEGRKFRHETQTIISDSLSTSQENMLRRSSQQLRKSRDTQNQSSDTKADGVLTEDEMIEMAADTTELELYGDAKEFNSKRSDSKALYEAAKQHLFGRAIYQDYLERPTYFAIAREDGQFEIWRLSSLSSSQSSNSISAELVFRCSNLHNGRQFMDHENDSKKSADLPPMDGEICIASVGSQNSLPFLIVKLDDGTIFSYSCHFYKSALVADKYLPIRFVRRHMDQICHNLPLEENAAKDAESLGESKSIDEPLSVITTIRRSLTHPTITPFHSLAGRYSGFFVAGDSPLWLFCERDFLRPQRVAELRTHGQKSKFAHKVTAFAPLNTPSCPSGFIYTSNGKMNLATMDPLWDVEASGGGVCTKRIQINETVHNVSYDRENHYIIATTSVRKKDMIRYLKGAADDKKEADLAKKIAEGTAQPLVYDLSTLDPRLPPIWEDQFYVKLIDPETWAVVTSYECNPEEVAKAKMINVMNYIPIPSNDPTPAAVLNTTFEAKRLVAPYKVIPVLVIGTSIVRGEDAACKGRIIVLDVIEEPSLEDGTRRARLEPRAERMCLQPITALDVLDGHLLTAEGRSFYVYQLRVEGGLYRIGFLDAQLSTVSFTVMRNYVLYGDVHHSIRLMRWLKAPHNWLQLVAKDPSPLDTVGTGVLVEGDKATFLVTDERGNIYMHAFTPSSNPEIVPAFDPVGDFHYGTHVKTLTRFRVGALPKDDPSALRNHGVLLGGHDGSMGFLMPVPAGLFQDLKKLESHLVTSLEHTAGLHPFAFRYPKPAYRMSHPHNRAVLDGDLLFRFLHLERTKQEELAKAIQAHSKSIIDTLARFNMQSTFE